MATKANPGKFDCYANAKPREPIFVLLGRDRMAPALVTLWARTRGAMGESQEQVEEALQCAEAMRTWAEAMNKEPFTLGDMITTSSARSGLEVREMEGALLSLGRMFRSRFTGDQDIDKMYAWLCDAAEKMGCDVQKVKQTVDQHGT